MKIEHIAIWVRDIEKMKDFYTKYFGMKSNDLYVNQKKQFSSYFLSFDDSSSRIELMTRADIIELEGSHSIGFGYTHISISVGNRENVHVLTERLRTDGFTIFGEPRVTGDGYYESVIEDPEGNHIEIAE
ncbi:glyoxalase/bleomycin resistance/extradiol dioxygenase family protein [Flammeovirga pectinis]|uniref:Glyoxalase/bleomycin resistance/extradiol dioxygenase family protein n=1 Tax=Flammeovirga pectinis TaxID=2494373 RepID=A0A3Q9FRQ3_9BACT|nr:VOC family protein [Flammeovirga pectinis]AZQ62950.1 glyoxalase/bleomycin resistance/extradiol dioxygenase family protein [Flammeovirga pectinis]